MRFASLGSGSEGNGLIVEVSSAARTWRVLLDCGFAVRECERRLARLGLDAAALDAILVTHEHSDHLGGVLRLARRYGIPVWATYGTLQASLPLDLEGVDVRTLVAATPVRFGHLEVTPFAVPHDAREPVQFRFNDGERNLAVLTDVGRATAHILEMLGGCDGLVLECNHDRAMLEASSYPAALKRRIRGDFGHLDNDQAADILARIDRTRLVTIVAAHLSRSNNTKALARSALARASGRTVDEILVADQDQGLDWVDL